MAARLTESGAITPINVREFLLSLRPLRALLLAAPLAFLSLPSVAAGADAPGGLYVGYYQEDPATNPEDPTAGAFSLTLPDADGSFSGSMYFTYVGCQSSNVGAVTGTRTGAALAGRWSGTVDGSPQSGSYSGRFDAALQSYAGTYGVDGGKQFRDLSPCVQYWIAPKGTWEMFAVEANVPTGFAVDAKGRTISWTTLGAPAALALVYLLDPASAATAGANPVLWQTLAPASSPFQLPPTLRLQPHKQYIVAVALSNARHERVAFGSHRFTTP